MTQSDVIASSTLLERPRLLRRLAEHPDRTALICAPCGYGKSVLLEQWLATEDRDVVSVSLGEEHGDAPLLADAIVEGLSHDRASPTATAIGSTEFPGEALGRFLATAADRRGPFVLALDDVSNVRGHEAEAILEALSRAIPAGSRLILVSRADPPIRVGRLRANRRLTEIRRADLTMTKEECAATLERMGVAVSERHLDLAFQQTEGWPAAVYLLGLALHGRSDQARAIARFSGADPLIADYMREELLGSLSVAQREFLRLVSPLERLSAPLCDAVLVRDDSEKVLRRLSGTNLLRGLDHRGEWCRLHPLLRGLLQVELHRDDPEAEQLVHARASAWWGPEGFADFALHHASEANDARRAGEVFWEVTPDYLVRGKAPAVMGWLARLGEASLATSPGLSLAEAWCRMAMGSGPKAQHWASVARDLLDSENTDDPSLMAGLTLLDAALARRGVPEMVDSLDGVDELLPDGSTWQAVRCLLLGVGERLRGNADAAQAALEEGSQRGGFRAPLLEALCRSQLASAAFDRGDLADAAAEAGRARALVEHDGLSGCPIGAMVYATSACMLAARGTFDRAGSDLRAAEKLAGQLEDYAAWYEVETHIALAHAHAGIGNRREANEHLAAAAAREGRVLGAPLLRRRISEASQRIADLSASAETLLTPAELRVLRLLPTHLSLPQIGESLCVSTNTVKTHTRNIYAKFGVSSRRAAVASAERDGLFHDQRLDVVPA